MVRSQRHFTIRLLSLSLLSAALAFGARFVRDHGWIPHNLLWLVVLIPVLPMVGYFIGVRQWIESLDELQRHIQLESLLIQFGITSIVLMTYGVLANASAVPDLPISDAWPLIWLVSFLGWVIGQIIVRRKYCD